MPDEVCTVNDDKGPCIFPFSYQGRTFENCTYYDDIGQDPWCALVPLLENDENEWGYCNMTRCVAEPSTYPVCDSNVRQGVLDWTFSQLCQDDKDCKVLFATPNGIITQEDCECILKLDVDMVFLIQTTSLFGI